MQMKDITGHRFGRWLVLNFSHRDGTTYFWNCRCDCGTKKPVTGLSLKNGTSVSCGCYQRERVKACVTKHGMSRTPEYTAWQHMKDRCDNIKNPAYRDYGGRGIKLCSEWYDFKVFLANMGPRPSARHSLERINNDLGYSLGNCKWAEPPEQQNNKRVNRRLRFNGRVQTMTEWAEETGIGASRIWNRLADGWSTAEALTIPISQDKTGWETRRARQAKG